MIIDKGVGTDLQSRHVRYAEISFLRGRVNIIMSLAVITVVLK